MILIVKRETKCLKFFLAKKSHEIFSLEDGVKDNKTVKSFYVLD